MYYKKIVGEKVYLSPMDLENELTILTKWLNEDEEIAHYNGFYSSLLGEDKIKEMVEKWNEGFYSFSIVSLDKDEYIGNLSLFNIDKHFDSATLGIFIGNEYRNKGYGKEAIELICEYAFNMINLHSIHLEVYAYNEKGICVYKKLGFKECGRWHETHFHNGKYHDVVLMEKLNPNHKGEL